MFVLSGSLEDDEDEDEDDLELGDVEHMVMDTDIITGDISGTRRVVDPDPNWIRF